MANYSTNEFKAGLKILIDGDPYAIVENEMVKPGKGQAFNRVRVRNLKTGRTIERTWKSGDTVEAADVVDTDMQYLYREGDFFNFMVPDTYEQLTASKEAVGDGAQWLKDGTVCVVTLWNGVPLQVVPPAHMELKVIETDPGVRGDTATGGSKPAKLETGAMVRASIRAPASICRAARTEADGGRRCRSGIVDRERHRIGEARGAEADGHEAIETERDSRAVGQAGGKRCEQPLVQRGAGLAACLARR
jgi:elongation factor P